MNLTLKPVSKEDYKFLYRLLKQRPKDECISHRAMPTYYQHCKFLNSKPYARNWIVLDKDKLVGNLYETRLSEIGIHLSKDFIYLLPQVIEDILYVAKELKKKIYFNINPNDKRFKSLLTKNCRLIQHTYENILG
jgi:hypothetical protein